MGRCTLVIATVVWTTVMIYLHLVLWHYTTSTVFLPSIVMEGRAGQAHYKVFTACGHCLHAGLIAVGDDTYAEVVDSDGLLRLTLPDEERDVVICCRCNLHIICGVLTLRPDPPAPCVYAWPDDHTIPTVISLA